MSISGISQLLLTQFGPNFKGKVKARSRQGQGKVKARSRQRSKPGQGQAKRRSGQVHGKVKERFRQGKSKVKERSRQGLEARSRQDQFNVSKATINTKYILIFGQASVFDKNLFWTQIVLNSNYL